MNLALKCEGRTIHAVIDITLTTKDQWEGTVGHTDYAMDIGKGLINEVHKVLVMAAEKEGFKVTVQRKITVY